VPSAPAGRQTSPGVSNFLSPLYQTGAGSNYGRYSSKDFDNLLKEGGAAADAKEAQTKYDEAQQVLLKDLPAIPLWYQNVESVWNKDLKNVQVGWELRAAVLPDHQVI
jgi:oligopeptide transport system substrate-binding protein